MKELLILGAGTAGTIMANRMRRRLDPVQWRIRVVDEHPTHFYQPGFLFLPFGIYEPEDIIRPKRRFMPSGVEYVEARAERIEPENNRVVLGDGRILPYDVLIVATGTHPVPGQVEGMLGDDWGRRVFEFYTFDGARRLTEHLRQWRGGRLVVHVSEMPIKCPVAPLEFVFLADWWLQTQGLRDRTELVYVTPLSGAFTKPVASRVLGDLLERKRIQVVTDFAVARVDNERHRLVAWDDREVPYDLLVTVPPNFGAEVIERSGLGDEMNFVPTDRHTLQARGHDNIFVLGDATDLPTSKAGSVAHFEAEVLTENLLAFTRHQPLPARFDGHANCFVETGFHKAILLDFNYNLEPVPGRFPLPYLGPLRLLGESRLNHWGKMAFLWMYWHLLLPGRPIPFVHHQMSLAGKQIPAGALKPEMAG
ncbi:type III sulfide quinone reductase, selenoprotein subtype [Limisphaera sp. VF-2]|uniref:type III sulfide quinone reductase, selenoprotein subtype n=1 Tax=Limisphaera sp. VF-2 TaxID=3400418 RepID=UPI0017708287